MLGRAAARRACKPRLQVLWSPLVLLHKCKNLTTEFASEITAARARERAQGASSKSESERDRQRGKACVVHTYEYKSVLCVCAHASVYAPPALPDLHMQVV
jgi:hypothetical protein